MSSSAFRHRSVLVGVFLSLALLPAQGCESRPSEEISPDPELVELLEREAPKAEPPPSFPQQWTIQSPDGRRVLRQITSDGDTCTLRAVTRETEEVIWEAAGCLATREDIRLLAPDGERLMVIFPRPPLDVSPVGDVPVAYIYRRGELTRTFIAREFIDPTRFEVIEDGLVWLAHGPNGPLLRHRGEGAELTLIGNRQAVISFEGGIEISEPVVPVAPRQEEKPVTRCPAGLPCSYIDSQGVFHVVESGALVPEEYLESARPLEGGITEVGSTNSANDITLPAPFEPTPREPPRASPSPSQDRGSRSLGRIGRSSGTGATEAAGETVEMPFEETVLQRAIRLGTRAGAPLPAPIADPDTATRYDTDHTGSMEPLR